MSCNRCILVHKTWSAKRPGSTQGQPRDPFVPFVPFFPVHCAHYSHTWGRCDILTWEWAPSILVKPALGDIYFPEQDILVGSQKRCLLSLLFYSYLRVIMKHLSMFSHHSVGPAPAGGLRSPVVEHFAVSHPHSPTAPWWQGHTLHNTFQILPSPPVWFN